VFGAHVWRRDPPCARRRNKEYLLNSLLTIESSALAFHGINGLQDGDQGDKAPPTVREDQVWDYRRNLNVHKAVGPDEMCTRVLRELAETLWQSGEAPGDWRKQNIVPISKKGRKEDPGTTDLSASSLCLGGSWNRSS